MAGSPRRQRSRAEIARILGAASAVAGLLYLLLPGPAFLILLVLLGPVAVWLRHPASDAEAALIGATASGGAALALLIFRVLSGLMLALLAALLTAGVMPEDEPSTLDFVAFTARDVALGWATNSPSALDFLAVLVGSALGGGATALIARIISDMVPSQ